MKTFRLTILIPALLLSFVLGLALSTASARSHMQSVEVDTAGYVQDVDSFVLILDTSKSMKEKYQGTTELASAKNMVLKLNHAIPQDLDLTGGLRVFGAIGTGARTKRTAELYGIKQYNRESYDMALFTAPSKARGQTFLGEAIKMAGQDLQGQRGKIALIIVSDGAEFDDDPVQAVEELKEQFGQRICVHTLHVGTDLEGRSVLAGISEASECGVTAWDSQLESAAGLEAFVRAVFYKESAEKMAMKGDADNDGVGDEVDECPDTPQGANVDDSGCWNLDSMINHVLFDFNEAELHENARKFLDHVASVLQQNPEIGLTVHGHTCNVGTEKRNEPLSEKRAAAVRDYLESQGVAAERMRIRGHGSADPVATNETTVGRILNRRAVLVPSGR